MRTLRSRGLSPRRVLGVHVLRNAASPALTVASLQFVGVLSGAVVVEQVFDLHGLGSSLQGASIGGDMPVVMGVVAVAVASVVAVNLAVDIFLAWLNPKIRDAR
ncbi:ABC transporter permease subunit [Yinghuangia aomiensis]